MPAVGAGYTAVEVAGVLANALEVIHTFFESVKIVHCVPLIRISLML